MGREIDLSIIIVSWNVSDLLRACLETVMAGSLVLDEGRSGGIKAEIIVVDSASEDDTLAMLKDFPQVVVDAQGENIGFTRGNNQGFVRARGRYLLMLNPDTEVMGDAIAQMVAYMDAHPDVGIVGPRTLNSDGSIQSTRRRFHTRWTAFFESTWLEGYAPRHVLDEFYVKDIEDDAIADVDWVQGSALMARREVYEQVGGLDEGYIMYAEEMDWCKRAKDAGWRVVYWGVGSIVHHGGKSTEQAGAFKHIHFQTSKVRYFRKYHGVLFSEILRLFLLVSYASQYMIEGIKAFIGHKRRMRQGRMRVYRQVIQNGLRATD